MEYTDTIIKSHKLKSVLKITFLFLFFVPFLFLMFFDYSFVLSLTSILGLIGLLVISIMTAKLYNWPVLLFIIIFAGLVFKRQHYPLAGVLMTVGSKCKSKLCHWQSLILRAIVIRLILLRQFF